MSDTGAAGRPDAGSADATGAGSADTSGPRSSNRAVRVLAPADGRAAAACLARGFDQEPAKLAMLPRPEQRQVVLEMAAANQLHAALRYGTAHAAVVDGELASVAVWSPPGVSPITASGAVRAGLALLTNLPAVAGAVPQVVSVLVRDLPGGVALVRQRRRAVDQASRGLTWHLLLFATVPEHRGQGLGRLLLDRQLHRCDEDGAAVWLETTDPVNPPIYERFGFSTVAHTAGPAWLPGLWVMRREPGAAG